MQKGWVIIQGEGFFLQSDEKKEEDSSQVASLRRGADLRRGEEADGFPWNVSMENTIAWSSLLRVEILVLLL